MGSWRRGSAPFDIPSGERGCRTLGKTPQKAAASSSGGSGTCPRAHPPALEPRRANGHGWLTVGPSSTRVFRRHRFSNSGPRRVSRTGEDRGAKGPASGPRARTEVKATQEGFADCRRPAPDLWLPVRPVSLTGPCPSLWPRGALAPAGQTLRLGPKGRSSGPAPTRVAAGRVDSSPGMLRWTPSSLRDEGGPQAALVAAAPLGKATATQPRS